MKELNLSKGLLDSVTGVLKDSSKVQAEQAKVENERLASKFTMPRPLSMEEAKVASYAAKAPERRVTDTISALYSKSVAENTARQQAEAEAVKNAYAARGGVKPVTEEIVAEALTPKQKKLDINKNKKIDAYDLATLRARKDKAQADVADETILDGETIIEKDIGKHNNATTGFKALVNKLKGKYGEEGAAKIAGSVKKKVVANEEKDTPGNSYEHQCAIHVKHASLGEGRTLFSQHAEPDAEGNIAWYDVMFAEGIEKQVPTSDLEILVSESHMNHPKKKKK